MILRHRLALIIALVGAVVMALLAFGLLLPPEYPFFGSRLYDLYAQALSQGRFDLPAPELRFEGHYKPDGTGYLYHGAGPVITRLPFLPFLDMPTVWLAPLSIWFWSVAGNILYHRSMLLALEHSEFATAGVPGPVYLLLSLLIWFGSPGLLLVASGTVYYEPIAMAYGLCGGFVYLIVKLGLGGVALERVLLPLALLGGLTVHARPHLAVGLYLGVCLLAAFAFFVVATSRARIAAFAAVLVLGLSGGGLLAMNALRFGDVATMHGSFSKSDLQYGKVFWGFEEADSKRARTFEEHGRFNAGRILPNAALYVATPPELPGLERFFEAISEIHGSAVGPFGYSRIERPWVGTAFLWPLWSIMMIVGLAGRAIWRMPAVAGLVGVATGSALLLAYSTITLRYHIDLWPLIALSAAFGIGPLCGWLTRLSRWLQFCWPYLAELA